MAEFLIPRRLLIAGGAALLALPARAQGAPAAVVERLHAALLDAMRQAQRLGVRGRYERLAPVIQASFDLPAMARISVGPPWTRMSPQEQQAVVQAFSEWSIATYASRFDGFAGEQFVTDGTAPTQSGDQMVRTRLVRPNAEPVALNYLMRQSGGGWRIVDVYLAGNISELASRRSEFSAVVREGGGERLAAELRRRTQELMRG